MGLISSQLIIPYADFDSFKFSYKVLQTQTLADAFEPRLEQAMLHLAQLTKQVEHKPQQGWIDYQEVLLLGLDQEIINRYVVENF